MPCVGIKAESLNSKKLLAKVLSNQTNVSFSDFKRLVQAFGFILDRVKVSHHVFKHPDIK